MQRRCCYPAFRPVCDHGLDLLSLSVISRDSSEHLKCISEPKDKEIRCLAVMAEP